MSIKPTTSNISGAMRCKKTAGGLVRVESTRDFSYSFNNKVFSWSIFQTTAALVHNDRPINRCSVCTHTPGETQGLSMSRVQ